MMEPIDGEELLDRRIIHYHYDETTRAIAASAFMKKKNLDPEVSVFLARLCSPCALLAAGLPGQRPVALKAQVAHDAGLRVVSQPIEGLPGHCVIVGFGADTWKAQCLRLAEGSRLVDVRTQRQ